MTERRSKLALFLGLFAVGSTSCVIETHYAPAEPSPEHVRVTFRNDASVAASVSYFREAATCGDRVRAGAGGVVKPETSETIILDRTGEFTFSFGTFQQDMSGGVGLLGQAIYDAIQKPCPERIDSFRLEAGHHYEVREVRTPRTISSDCEIHIIDRSMEPDGTIREIPVEIHNRERTKFFASSEAACEPYDPGASDAGPGPEPTSEDRDG